MGSRRIFIKGDIIKSFRGLHITYKIIDTTNNYNIIVKPIDQAHIPISYANHSHSMKYLQLNFKLLIKDILKKL